MDDARAVVAGLGPAGGDAVARVREWDLAAAMSAEAFRANEVFPARTSRTNVT
jgi:hypothetical protein